MKPTATSHCEVPPTNTANTSSRADCTVAALFCVFLVLVYFGVV